MRMPPSRMGCESTSVMILLIFWNPKAWKENASNVNHEIIYWNKELTVSFSAIFMEPWTCVPWNVRKESVCKNSAISQNMNTFLENSLLLNCWTHVVHVDKICSLVGIVEKGIVLLNKTFAYGLIIRIQRHFGLLIKLT